MPDAATSKEEADKEQTRLLHHGRTLQPIGGSESVNSGNAFITPVTLGEVLI